MFERCDADTMTVIDTAIAEARALERALAGATRRGLAAVDPCALLLGMVDEECALSNRLLRDLGVPPDELRAAILRAAS